MPEQASVILSQSYSPAWDVRLDNEKVKYYPFQSLMSFRLPAGHQKLTMTYEMTPIQKASLGLSAFSLVMLVGVVAFWGSVKPQAKSGGPSSK